MEYRPPNVTVQQSSGERIKFNDSLLSATDKQYCSLANSVLANSYGSIPYRVIQVMDFGCIVEELPGGNPLYSHETMMIWKDSRYSVAVGGTYQTDIFGAGSYNYTTVDGRKKNIRSFALSLDQAVSVIQNGYSSHARRAQNTPPTVAKKEESSGTGFAITSMGHLVTNAHVVGDAQSITVNVHDKMFLASVLAVDKTNDLAIIKITGATIPLRIGFDANVRLGDEITVGGFPFPDLQGTSLKLTKGVISAMKGLHDDARHYQIDASIQGGNSGGPLLNSQGSVIGVVNSQINSFLVIEMYGRLPQNVNFAIKAEFLGPLLYKVPGLVQQVAAETYAGGFSNGEYLERSTHLIMCK